MYRARKFNTKYVENTVTFFKIQSIIDLLQSKLYLFIFLFQDIGAGKGKYYAVNFPLRDGIDDESYHRIFEPVSREDNYL